MNVPEQPKRPLLARLLSLEGAMAAFGLYSLVSGFAGGDGLQVFWGIMILGGLCLLLAVRRRDWKRHWEEMEAAAARRTHSGLPENTDTPRRED